MADKKKSAVEKDDPLALETQRILNNMRDAQPLLSEFLKASQKFTQQLGAAVTAGGVMLEALAKLAEHVGGDLGEEGVKHLFEAQKALEEHRHQVVQAWADQVQADLVNRLPTDKTEVAAWEKNYKAKRQTSLKALKKAEAAQQKLNKPKARAKSPDKADEADRQLAAASTDHDRLLREELREAVRFERKKYCRFLQQFGFLMDVQANMALADLTALATCRNTLASLPESEESITGRARILLSDEGSPPPAYTPVPVPEGDNVAVVAARATELVRSNGASSSDPAAPVSGVVPAFDPVAAASALLDPLATGNSGTSSVGSRGGPEAGMAVVEDGIGMVQQPVQFQNNGMESGAAPPLDDLLQDDLWNLVNGGGNGTNAQPAQASFAHDAPPADADIAAALRDIDELAINL